MRTLLLLPLVACPLVCLWGCQIDNKLGQETENPGFDSGESVPFADAAITADPSFVAELGVCGSVHRTITLASTGTSDLTVADVVVDGEGWTMTGPDLPLVLAPGETAAIELTGTAGSATLTISSDASNDPDLQILLDATADLPPTVTMISPSAGSVLEVSDTVFTATVTDDFDAPETLALQWSGSVDGVLGTDPADSSGAATLSWISAEHSSGAQDVSLTATDHCGNAAVAALDVCQQAGYIEDSIDLESWHFEGMANWNGTDGWLELTKPVTGQLASAFNTADVVTGDDVAIEFQFYVSGGSGADGLSLTALDTDRMTGYLGASGGSIGYGSDGASPGLPGWSIEVDTYDNGMPQDPTPLDHVMFTFDGNQASGSAWAALPEMEDGAWHTMTVVVKDPHVTVQIDGVAYIDQDISGYYDFPAIVGFTAATGSLTNFHLVDALQVTEYVCPE